MDVVTHTTPESRRVLRQYLRDRRMTTSIHQTTTAQALNDLEEALQLLQGIEHPSAAWADEVAMFLAKRLPRPEPTGRRELPGLLEGA